MKKAKWKAWVNVDWSEEHTFYVLTTTDIEAFKEVLKQLNFPKNQINYLNLGNELSYGEGSITNFDTSSFDTSLKEE